MIRKLDHIVLTTTDFIACAAFYKTLGFSVKDGVNRLELFSGDFKINVHKRGAELSPHAKNIAVGSADICFEVDDLPMFFEQLKENHIPIELGIVSRTGARGAMQSVYIRDFDGNLLEFCSYE